MEIKGRLGTFGGVFTPSILTILGIILFLRLGYVVGNAGLLSALVIIAGATLVSVLTSISVAAIATNIEVKGGGDYYLISRTLGVEFGGAIGIVLFLAQSVSVGFYAIGFGEAVAAIAGWESVAAVEAVAAGAVGVLFLLAWAGADVATRFQYLVMIALVAALVSFYVGAFDGASAATLGDGLRAPDGTLGFWATFAIFFPAVTGFTQGVSMSGDLRTPGRSLPLGTFAAVGLSAVVYLSVAVLLAANATGPDLVDDTGILGRVAAFPVLIDVGVVAATLSSAMASFLGGPRILQSLASDRIFPALDRFARGHGSAHNPRRATVLSLVIAMATIALGSLDTIAPVVTMFFLVSYGLLNYATYYEARAASPSFRPRFRFFSRRASLLGALACLGAMLAINLTAGAVAVLVLAGIYQYLARRPHTERWADASASHHFQRAKESIRAMASESDHSRNWRPQVIVFSADSARRERLLTFATWMEGRSGLTAAITILEGQGALARRERDEAHAQLASQVAELGLDVHSAVVLSEHGIRSLPVVVQSFGVGPLSANTTLFGLPEAGSDSTMATYVATLQEVARFGRNVVVMSTDAQRWQALLDTPAAARVIDVWWTDDDSGRLAALTAYLFTRTRPWSDARVRVVAATSADGDPEETRQAVAETMRRARLPTTTVAVATEDAHGLVEASASATLVFAPIRLRDGQVLDHFGGDIGEWIDRVPATAGFLAGAPIALDAGPESAAAARLAIAESAIEAAQHRRATLEKRLGAVERQVEELRAATVHGSARRRARELADAERRLADARRRALKAAAVEESARAEHQAQLDDAD